MENTNSNTAIKQTMNAIGLDTDNTKELIFGLNELLADYQIFYMNVRGFHWNIKGDKFFELHVKFEEFYDDLALKIDEVAERILMLKARHCALLKITLQQAVFKNTRM